MTKSLAEMADEVEVCNREHGWYDAERSFGDLIALLHSEVSEALEAFREVKLDYRDTEKWESDSGHIDQLRMTLKPDDVASELADVLIRCLDMAKRYGYDLEAEYERKMAYNRTRPYLHGGKVL